MAYIPESAMFCAGTVEDAKKLLEGQSEGQPHSELLAPNNRATLALLFMHEVYKAKESKWAPLLNNLPRTVHSPLTYTLEELDVINGTFAERKAREFTDYLKSVWYELVEPSMLGNMTVEERFFARGATVDMTFELFKQAVSVTMAYGVTLTHGGVQQVNIHNLTLTLSHTLTHIHTYPIMVIIIAILIIIIYIYIYFYTLHRNIHTHTHTHTNLFL